MTTYYTVSGVPVSHSFGGSAYMRSEFTAVQAAFVAVNGDMLLKGSAAGQIWNGNHDFTGGTISVPTQAPGDNSNKAASTAYADALSVAAGNVPPGGAAGATLVKISADDYDMDWATLGGAVEVTSAVDITLTVASLKVQAVSMTVADKSVIMPSATTLQTGGEIYAIRNSGALAYRLNDAAGGYLANLDPGQMIALYLSDASTVAGTWAVMTSQAGSVAQAPYQALATVINAVASTHVSVTQMSATQAIAAWSGASGYLNCCTLNIAGNVVTAGAVLVVNAVGSNYISVTAVSSTQAVVAYSGASTYIYACTLNVSGTNLTNGTVLTVNAVASTFCAVSAMSSTQCIVTYSGTTGYTQACTLNISGTTLTAGAILSVNAINSSYQAITMMSATQALIAYSSSSAFLQVCTLNVSGTTLTAGAILSLTTTDSRFPSLASITSTQAAIAYTGPTTMFQLNARTLNISGTTVTAGGITVQPVTPVQSVFSSLKKISANKLALLSSVDALGSGATYGARAQILGLTDGQVSPGTSATVKGAAGSYAALAVMTETKVLAVYPESSGYVQARILEIAA